MKDCCAVLELARSSYYHCVKQPDKSALRHHPAPAIHHADQGTQYADHSYVKLLQDAGTQISMAAAGEPSG